MTQTIDPVKRAYINSHRQMFGDALVNARIVIIVFFYFNDPDVHDKWVNSGNQATHIAWYWNYWTSKHMTVMAQHGKVFAVTCLS